MSQEKRTNILITLAGRAADPLRPHSCGQEPAISLGGGVALKDIILRTVSFAVGSGKGLNQNASILQPTVAILDE
jgi:hypothetical protein